MVSKWIVRKFFRYRTLMSIKWFEPFLFKFWILQFGKNYEYFNPSFLSNAESTTYVWIKKNSLDLKKKKKQRCWQLFVWSEESSEYSGLGLVISFEIFFLNMNREGRIGSLYSKKIWEFLIKNWSNWAREPNESKDSCLVREGIVEVLK